MIRTLGENVASFDGGLPDVSLLRADEAVFNAMIDGWRAQMLARGLGVNTIKPAAGSYLDSSNSPTSIRGGGGQSTPTCSWLT